MTSENAVLVRVESREQGALALPVSLGHEPGAVRVVGVEHLFERGLLTGLGGLAFGALLFLGRGCRSQSRTLRCVLVRGLRSLELFLELVVVGFDFSSVTVLARFFAARRLELRLELGSISLDLVQGTVRHHVAATERGKFVFHVTHTENVLHGHAHVVVVLVVLVVLVHGQEPAAETAHGCRQL